MHGWFKACPTARNGSTRLSSTGIAASLGEMRVASRYGRGAKIFLSSLPRKFFNSLKTREVLQMSQIDWAKIYAEMDKRIVVKYEQLPKGEQIGKRAQAETQQVKAS